VRVAARAWWPQTVVTVMEELVQRHGLRIALQGRDQQTLQPLVAFVARQITAPPFAPTLIGVANLLLDMYAPVLGQSAAIDELFVRVPSSPHPSPQPSSKPEATSEPQATGH
jgi:hypothetical protein